MQRVVTFMEQRRMGPTSKILLSHYARHYKADDGLADLVFNIVFLRNTMSKEIVKMCEEEKMPWLHVEQGRVSEQSKKDVDAIFLFGRTSFLSKRGAHEITEQIASSWLERVFERARPLRPASPRSGCSVGGRRKGCRASLQTHQENLRFWRKGVPREGNRFGFA